jgi:hypothetical protein
MKFSRALLVAALLPLALSSCKDQKLRDALELWIHGDPNPPTQKGVVQWQEQVVQAICNIELYLQDHPVDSAALPNPNWRLCPNQQSLGTGSVDPGGDPPPPPDWD